MAAIDQVGPGVDAGVGQIDLVLGGLIKQLLPPVKGAEHKLGPLCAQLSDGLRGGALAGVVVPVGTVDAQGQAAFRGEQLGLAVLAIGDAPGFQGGKGILGASLPKVVHVVVGGGDEIHPARKENLGPVGGGAEIEGLGGIHHLVGEGTLQVGKGEIIAVKIIDGVGEGIGIVPVHTHGVVVGALLPQHLVGGEGAVPHEGERKIFRLGLRRRRRGGRRCRRGRRRR